MFVWVNAHQQTDFVCSLTGFTHCLCVMSPWHSVKLFSRDKHRRYQMSRFYTCNLTCTWGMMNKHNFLLLQLRGKVKDGGMWAEWDDVFESLQCFVWPVYFSFLTMERANLIFTNINRTPETSHFNIEVQWCSWHISCLEWKQIGFIRTRHIRIHVVIEAEVKIFSTPVDWFNFLL